MNCPDRNRPARNRPARNRRALAATLGLCSLVLATDASADIVRLRNGDVLEGEATDLGESVRLVQADGIVEMPWSRVALIDRLATTRDVLAERRAEIKDDDVRGLYALGLWCERQGLVEEAGGLFEEVVALDPEHRAAREALGQEKDGGAWKKGSSLMEARGFVHHDGRWMLREEYESLMRRESRERKVTDEEKRAAGLLESLGDENPRVRSFAARAFESVDPALRRRLNLLGIRHRNKAVRLASAEGLGVKGDEGAVRSLLRAAVHDPSADVRAAAAVSLKTVAAPGTAQPLLRALSSNDGTVRANAAMALGQVGGRTTVETLIKRVHWVAGPSNRANIQVLNQVSYISDFDVEIAQLAQIGDPIISILREGVVLDVKVFGAQGTDTIVEKRAYTTALQRLTGQDFGDDARAWAKWWVDEGRAEFADADTGADAFSEGGAAIATPR